MLSQLLRTTVWAFSCRPAGSIFVSSCYFVTAFQHPQVGIPEQPMDTPAYPPASLGPTSPFSFGVDSAQAQWSASAQMHPLSAGHLCTPSPIPMPPQDFMQSPPSHGLSSNMQHSLFPEPAPLDMEVPPPVASRNIHRTPRRPQVCPLWSETGCIPLS